MKQIRTLWQTKTPLHTEMKIQLNMMRRNEKSKGTSKLLQKVLILICLLTRQESRSGLLTYFPYESGNLEFNTGIKLTPVGEADLSTSVSLGWKWIGSDCSWWGGLFWQGKPHPVEEISQSGRFIVRETRPGIQFAEPSTKLERQGITADGKGFA